MIRRYHFYMLAGASPFVAAAFAALTGVESIGPVRSVTAAVVAYGLAIASFVAGTHWGIYLQNRSTAPLNLFVTSNAAVLVPWLTYVVASTGSTLVALVLTFVFLAFVDWRLAALNLIEAAYMRLRLTVTAIVCLALALFAIFR